MNFARSRPAGLVQPRFLAALVLSFAPMSVADAAVVGAQERAEDFFNQGIEKLQRGDFEGALANFTEALRINPNLATAYASRGVVRSRLGDDQGAATDLQRAAD